MKLKDIECIHQWVWVGINHTFGPDGFVEDTYFELKCKNCGEIIKIKNIFDYEFEMDLDRTKIEKYEPWREIFT